MKKYIIPEATLLKLSSEDVMNTSSGLRVNNGDADVTQNIYEIGSEFWL